MRDDDEQYTDEQREEAATVLAIAASNAGDIECSCEASTLACDAFDRVPMVDAHGTPLSLAEQFAEAESWVRCGWTGPGDELLFR